MPMIRVLSNEEYLVEDAHAYGFYDVQWEEELEDGTWYVADGKLVIKLDDEGIVIDLLDVDNWPIKTAYLLITDLMEMTK